MENIQERDKKHLWHPLTQHQLKPDHLPIVKAQGCLLYDNQGKTYIDGIASWYTCMYGHSNPYIIEKVSAGLKELDQVVFSGFTHPPAVVLSEKLIEILPKNQQKIFFSDNGSTTVDIALKMAFQFHFNNGQKRNKIIAFEEGFHGDTFGAMSVSDLSVYNGPFNDFFLEVIRIPVPNNSAKYINDFMQLLQDESIASFIYEPLVQGAAGMKMYPPEVLGEMLDICSEKNVITIADEVMTGFGKTGRNFASDYLTELPDIICLSKSLTAGIAPMGITSCSEKIYNAFLSDDITAGFFHGHTYSANPLACNAAIAGIELLSGSDYQDNIKRISSKHKDFASTLESNPKVAETRNLGVILAIDLKVDAARYGNLRDQLFDFYMQNGVFLRPLGNTVYILAPFTISDQQLEYIYSIILESLKII